MNQNKLCFFSQAERESDGGKPSNEGNNNSVILEDTTRSVIGGTTN